jgi:hypothetical protein
MQISQCITFVPTQQSFPCGSKVKAAVMETNGSTNQQPTSLISDTQQLM